MQTPQYVRNVLRNTWTQNSVGIAAIAALLIWGELPAMLAVSGSVWLVRWLIPVEGLPQFILECIVSITILTALGIGLAAIATGFMKPAPKAEGSRRPSHVASWSVAAPLYRLANWAKTYFDKWRDKQLGNWLRKGKPLGFVLASYIGGAALVSGWSARKNKKHPFARGVAAAIVLAIPSGFTWTVIPYRPADAWMWPIPWIALLALIPFGVNAYHSRWVRYDWWLFRFIPEFFGGRRRKEAAQQELNRLRAERIAETQAAEAKKRTVSATVGLLTYVSCTQCCDWRRVDSPELAVYVAWPDDDRDELRTLLRMTEENVFWREDRNTPYSLYREAKLYPNTALIGIVDHRPGKDGRPRNKVTNMARVIWGSPEHSVPTRAALSKKPWKIGEERVIRASELPADLGHTPRTMDITMIAQESEYNGVTLGNGMPLSLALIAQMCQLGQDTGVTHMTTILSTKAERIARGLSRAPWTTFDGVGTKPYWGSAGSTPLYLRFTPYMAGLPQTNPEAFDQLFGTALSKYISFEPHERSIRHAALL
ncbi:MAG TPA: hypothetical protein VLF59_06305 [Candidatus Saccharimonadales bacterium]|nr:hypothetical protein [Candidatus Saccharimonadales bacterium]